MLAQLRVPSGFELGFGGSATAAGAGTASAETCSQDESRFVLSVFPESQPPVAVSVAGVSHVELSTAGVSSILAAGLPRAPLVKPPLPPRAAARPRSEPRPRPPRVPSKPPLPRPPRDEVLGASVGAPAGSLALD